MNMFGVRLLVHVLRVVRVVIVREGESSRSFDLDRWLSS